MDLLTFTAHLIPSGRCLKSFTFWTSCLMIVFVFTVSEFNFVSSSRLSLGGARR